MDMKNMTIKEFKHLVNNIPDFCNEYLLSVSDDIEPDKTLPENIEFYISNDEHTIKMGIEC